MPLIGNNYKKVPVTLLIGSNKKVASLIGKKIPVRR